MAYEIRTLSLQVLLVSHDQPGCCKHLSIEIKERLLFPTENVSAVALALRFGVFACRMCRDHCDRVLTRRSTSRSTGRCGACGVLTLNLHQHRQCHVVD